MQWRSLGLACIVVCAACNDEGDDGDGGADTAAATSVASGATTGSEATAAASGDGTGMSETTAAPMCEYVDPGPEGCPSGFGPCMEIGAAVNCAPVELVEVCCQTCPSPNECPG